VEGGLFSVCPEESSGLSEVWSSFLSCLDAPGPAPHLPFTMATSSAASDEFGAHVSAAGGVAMAPARAREIESSCLQFFTKQPSRWAEPVVDEALTLAFEEERHAHQIQVAGSHDSYLINLATPNPDLWDRSYESFRLELARCASLELDFLVTHPGNATDGDQESGISRNAEGVSRALEAVGGSTRVLLELTAGGGTTVGGSFENLAAILDQIPHELQSRLGVCFDTCHAYSAGYDLVGGYDGVWVAFGDALGLERLGLFHMNDSKNPFASRKDRHQHLGEGSLGVEPFRRIVQDPRFFGIPKILETPKETDPIGNDLNNLRLLRSFRRQL
jgi:deoxyribonuclease-4